VETGEQLHSLPVNRTVTSGGGLDCREFERYPVTVV